MRIESFAAYHLRVPLRMTIKHASHTRRENDAVVIACTMSDGTVGWGEGLPRPYVTGETIESVFEMLESPNVIGHFLGQCCADLAAAVSLCRSVNLGLQGRGFGNSLRCALELSILDAVTRSMKVPISAVFDAIPEIQSLRRMTKTVQYSLVFTDLPVRKLIFYSLWARLAGIRFVKLKVGVAGNNDLARLKTVRRAFGSNVDLRVDANEAWTPEELTQRLEDFRDVGISSVEQPVPHVRLAELAGLRGKAAVPIMLDESVCTRDDLDLAVREGYCDLINLRISKCGGLISTALLAAAAHDQRIGYQLGCQVGETGILSAAGRHLATSLDHIRYFEGSYDRYILKHPLTTPDITCAWSGRAPMLTSPGLGVDIDTHALRQMTVSERHWHAEPPSVLAGGRQV
ncbi:MAG: dipeptide epimerase [Planctomycetota bacterium]|nr:dipeptide epimerase [Planctomycetota bacterium]MDA1213212.1 dipeptide epimerase [Planctomycetota bacterium]